MAATNGEVGPRSTPTPACLFGFGGLEKSEEGVEMGMRGKGEKRSLRSELHGEVLRGCLE